MFGIHSAKGFNHFFTEFHGRRQVFRISSKNVSEINVKQTTTFGQHQIVQVTISNPKKVRDHAIAGAALDVGVHDLRLDTMWSRFAWIMFTEKVLNASFFADNFGNC